MGAARADGRRRITLAAAAGAAVGVAVLTKSSMLVVAPLALLPLAASPRTTLPAASAGFVPCAALWLAFEYARFGRPLASYAGEMFSHPVWDGLWRLVVGPNAGLLWFFPALVAVYSMVLGVFVPSGGSKWVIEAPYVIAAGKSLGVSNAITIIAYAWGDMVTDIIQPFWAIPLLGVAKLEFRDIMGYCILYFLLYMLIISAAFLLLPVFFAI